MLRFLKESEAHLAISLHTPFDTERQKLMPVQIAYPIADVVNEIKNYFALLPERCIFTPNLPSIAHREKQRNRDDRFDKEGH